ncbi:RDD family protein [Alkalibacillus haloalkaliphilus]|uniref:RDD family protein n=1 Tax=Alkalibacillus haloalkaliphilus TaxID=94136 RepID=UPI0029356114|nr:RDD family protein [Alkalibacillus haloalkaliphilus]MDV2582374.1 RDD family protein [Alkalibacillus haloalkaliphilus]
MNELQLASRKSRIFAFMIDHFILTLIAVFPLLFFVFNDEFINENIFPVLSSWISIILIIYFLKDLCRGVSVGKLIVGIAVRDGENGDNVPNKMRLFLRNLLLIVWPIEIILLATNKRKKRLGDQVANTDVVKVRKMSTWKTVVVVVLMIAMAITLLFSTVIFMITNSEAYDTAITYIEENEDVMRETGGIEGYGFVPTGSIEITNGYGESLIYIDVEGEDKDLDVAVYLTKKPDEEWVVEEFSYE